MWQVTVRKGTRENAHVHVSSQTQIQRHKLPSYSDAEIEPMPMFAHACRLIDLRQGRALS